MYSVRTGMEAAYQLLGIERGVPDVFGSTYDVRALLHATTALRDGEGMQLPGPEPLRRRLLGRIESNEIGQLLTEAGVISDL